MIRILTLILMMLAAPLAAQQLPAQFEVTGVAENDVLNIRAAPDAGADIIGEYGPYAFNIEVLETTPDGSWGLVGLGEGNGWVSMRYLAQRPTDPNSLPRPISCFGTEPFWSLGMYPRGDEFNALGEERRPLTLTHEAVAPNGFLATFQEGPTLDRTAVIERMQCSDGMSDRRFGWRVMLFTEAPDGNGVLSGCCTLDGN